MVGFLIRVYKEIAITRRGKDWIVTLPLEFASTYLIALAETLLGRTIEGVLLIRLQFLQRN